MGCLGIIALLFFFASLASGEPWAIAIAVIVGIAFFVPIISSLMSSGTNDTSSNNYQGSLRSPRVKSAWQTGNTYTTAPRKVTPPPILDRRILSKYLGQAKARLDLRDAKKVYKRFLEAHTNRGPVDVVRAVETFRSSVQVETDMLNRDVSWQRHRLKRLSSQIKSTSDELKTNRIDRTLRIRNELATLTSDYVKSVKLLNSRIFKRDSLKTDRTQYLLDHINTVVHGSGWQFPINQQVHVIYLDSFGEISAHQVKPLEVTKDTVRAVDVVTGDEASFPRQAVMDVVREPAELQEKVDSLRSTSLQRCKAEHARVEADLQGLLLGTQFSIEVPFDEYRKDNPQFKFRFRNVVEDLSSDKETIGDRNQEVTPASLESNPSEAQPPRLQLNTDLQNANSTRNEINQDHIGTDRNESLAAKDVHHETAGDETQISFSSSNQQTNADVETIEQWKKNVFPETNQDETNADESLSLVSLSKHPNYNEEIIGANSSLAIPKQTVEDLSSKSHPRNNADVETNEQFLRNGVPETNRDEIDADDSLSFVSLSESSKDSEESVHANSSLAIPERPMDDGQWLRPGEMIEIGKYTIHGGMIYVGLKLAPADEMQGSVEPSLIDPTLSVDTRSPNYKGYDFRHWPAYSELSPRSRAAYLEWLSTGRRDRKVNIGYVFIFFYGLERRALHDNNLLSLPSEELKAIYDEVKELIAVYGSNRSFSRYAKNFLSLLLIAKYSPRVHEILPEIDESEEEMPSHLKAALAQMAEEGISMDGSWAFIFYYFNVQMNRQSGRRKAFERCFKEAQILFIQKFNAKFPNGHRLRKLETNLNITYHTASRRRKPYTVPFSKSHFEFSLYKKDLQNLYLIGEECISELDSYSRWLGRNAGKERTMKAISLLPCSLLQHLDYSAISEFRSELDALLGNGNFSVLSATVFFCIVGYRSVRKDEQKRISRIGPGIRWAQNWNLSGHTFW